MHVIIWQGATDARREIGRQDVVNRAMNHWNSRLSVLLIMSLSVALPVRLVWKRPVGARLVHSCVRDPMVFLNSLLLPEIWMVCLTVGLIVRPVSQSL